MAKYRILIVDDELEVRKTLSAFLSKKFDCTITTASDGAKAIEKVSSGKFDLMLVDIKMPGLSGIDVMKEVSRRAPGTKMLVISAYDSDDVADSALKAGASDYVPKSYTLAQIGIKVKSLLSS
jgi:YesN/AraC family two-component response regulator